MDSIVGDLMGQLTSGDNLSSISNKAGTDEKSTKSVLEMGLPLLLGAMNQKASKPDGAQAILGSMAQMGNNNPMDNMASYLGASDSSQETSMLNSVLGNSLQPIEQMISKKTGVPPIVVSKILAMALPLVLGSLTKSSQKQNIGQGDLSKLLGDQSKMAMASSPDAAGVMNEVFTSEKGKGGLMGSLKKFMKI